MILGVHTVSKESMISKTLGLMASVEAGMPKIENKTKSKYACNRIGGYWAGPLARLSLPSVMSWIRSDTSIWKLALSQSCTPRIYNSKGRRDYIAGISLN